MALKYQFKKSNKHLLLGSYELSGNRGVSEHGGAVVFECSISLRAGHHFKPIEGCLCKSLTMVGMSDFYQGVGSLTQILAKQVGNTKLSHNVVYVSSRCHNTSTYKQTEKLKLLWKYNTCSIIIFSQAPRNCEKLDIIHARNFVPKKSWFSVAISDTQFTEFFVYFQANNERFWVGFISAHLNHLPPSIVLNHP